MDNEKKILSKAAKARRLRIGGYSVLLTVFAIIIVVVLNLIIRKLPESYTKFDMSTSKEYTLTDTTKNFVSGLKDDINIYLLAASGEEDDTLVNFIKRYMSVNDCLKLNYVDPEVNPGFTHDLNATSTPSSNSIIVESDKRTKVIDYTDLYKYTIYRGDQELGSYNQSNFEAILNQNYSSFSSGYFTYEQSFWGENELTSALDYVTTDNLPKAYLLSGHGESDLDTSLATSVKEENITYESINLSGLDAVPENAECVIINNPTVDISTDDLTKLNSYLTGGGDVMLLSCYGCSEFKNLMSLTASYGLNATDGVIFEDSTHYYGQPYFLLPSYGSHDITAKSNNYTIIAPNAHGIKKADTLPENVTVTELLSTSSNSYLKALNLLTGDNVSMTKQDGDTDGPFCISAIATKTAENVTSNMLWISSYQIPKEELVSQFQGNTEFFLSSLSYLCNKKESISISAKTINTSSNILNITEKKGNFIMVIVCILIPLTFICTGLGIWLYRRKR